MEQSHQWEESSKTPHLGRCETDVHIKCESTPYCLNQLTSGGYTVGVLCGTYLYHSVEDGVWSFYADVTCRHSMYKTIMPQEYN